MVVVGVFTLGYDTVVGTGFGPGVVSEGGSRRGYGVSVACHSICAVLMQELVIGDL